MSTTRVNVRKYLQLPSELVPDIGMNLKSEMSVKKNWQQWKHMPIDMSMNVLNGNMYQSFDHLKTKHFFHSNFHGFDLLCNPYLNAREREREKENRLHFLRL